MTGLTVQEVAALSGLHPQTVRKYIRDGELPATKTQGTNGPEWRITRKDAEALRQAQKTDSKPGDSDLRRALSSLVETTAELRDVQKALAPSPEEAQARADREARIAAALEAAPAAQELAQKLGRAEAERDQLRAERDRLRAELEEARRAPWWRRLVGGPGPEGGDGGGRIRVDPEREGRRGGNEGIGGNGMTWCVDVRSQREGRRRAKQARRAHPGARAFVVTEFLPEGGRRHRLVVTHDQQAFRITAG